MIIPVVLVFLIVYFSFFFNDTATTEIYTLSLHDALPISQLAVDDPEQRVSHMALMPVAERERVLRDWQGPETGYPLERCLHHWIEDQVERTPEKVAVLLADAGGGQLTYRELNVRANQLAQHL